MNSEVFRKISYGLYLVTSKAGDALNGQIANTLFQLCSKPPMMAVCLDKKNYTHELINKSNIFAATILSIDTPLNFIGNFGYKSGRDVDKLKDVSYKEGVTGAPIVLDNAVGYLEAKVVNSVETGDHTLFIGKVAEAQLLNNEPITYAQYRQIKSGRTLAPQTITANAREKEQKKGGSKYICTICQYIYDPEKGDPDSGIKPGTLFEELPDDWICPVCGAKKSAFRMLE